MTTLHAANPAHSVPRFSYEDLLVKWILTPMGFNDTSVARLTADWHESGHVPLQNSRMSPGHDRYNGKVRIRREPC